MLSRVHLECIWEGKVWPAQTGWDPCTDALALLAPERLPGLSPTTPGFRAWQTGDCANAQRWSRIQAVLWPPPLLGGRGTHITVLVPALPCTSQRAAMAAGVIGPSGGCLTLWGWKVAYPQERRDVGMFQIRALRRQPQGTRKRSHPGIIFSVPESSSFYLWPCSRKPSNFSLSLATVSSLP